MSPSLLVRLSPNLVIVYSSPVFIAIVFFPFLFRVHAGKLRQVTTFTIVGSTAKCCVDQYMVLFCYFSLGGYRAIPGRLHARL